MRRDDDLCLSSASFIHHNLIVYLPSSPTYRFYNTDFFKDRPSTVILSDDRFIISGTPDVETPVSPDNLWKPDSKLYGILFGGNPNVVIPVTDLMKDYFVRYLDQGLVNNEQIMMRLIIQENPDLFEVYYNMNVEGGYPFTCLLRVLHGDVDGVTYGIWRPGKN